jgi:hypothetical protein
MSCNPTKKIHGEINLIGQNTNLEFFWVKQASLVNFEWYNLFMG